MSAERDWTHLRERLADIGELAAEIEPGLEWGTYRFLFAVITVMAQDAAVLAGQLEAELVRLATEHGVELPPMDLGGGLHGEAGASAPAVDSAAVWEGL
ncbi:hypothetical protein C7C46_16050 [Streptomyces tateyamensis]|uniref:Uncharacterized protein n=1 Tax=Streptomyces tateyamensis TaxID=565073 RepID=A0A2V4N444_9ACTN|nr:hypothetical protein [Streptomyces tateyamensis]PYC78611.1 hypothetical protein C7C46_16050 [Streptomyces tateyamensis]